MVRPVFNDDTQGASRAGIGKSRLKLGRGGQTCQRWPDMDLAEGTGFFCPPKKRVPGPDFAFPFASLIAQTDTYDLTLSITTTTTSTLPQ
jgi:hypothetical protein